MNRMTTATRGRLLLAGCILALSALAAFTSAAAEAVATSGPNFTNTFNGRAPGWTAVVGTWTAGPTSYDTAGVSGQMASAAHVKLYDNFVYTVTTAHNTGFAGYIWFRGTPGVRAANDFWSNSYAFGWTSGQYAVFRTDGNGASTTLVPQQASGLLNASGDNTIRVTAVDGVIGFTVNGTPLAAIVDTTFTSGSVGVGFFSLGSGSFAVDAAKLRRIRPAIVRGAPDTTNRVLYAEGTPVEHPAVNLTDPGRP